MSIFSDITKSVSGLFGKKSYFGVRNSLPGLSTNWGKSDFLGANSISLYTNKAIKKRAEKVGQVRFILKKGDKVIENDKRLDLLYNPNKFFTGPEFWELFQKYKDITGEAFILMVSDREVFQTRKVTELHLLRPDLVEIEISDNGDITGYKFKPGTASEVKYSPEEIIYSFNPDPSNPLRGESLLKAGVRAIQTENEISEYHAKILKNGGKVEGVFKFKGSKLSETQIGNLKKQYQKEYAGAKAAGIPLFLGGDSEYQNIGLNPQELSFLEAKKITLADICIMTGVPKSILGSLDDVKYDNAEASRRMFLRETIKPLIENLTAKLDLNLFPEGDLNLSFEDPTPEDNEYKLKQLETASNVYALTQDEKREWLGLEPLPNGKGQDVLVPFNLSPLGQTTDKSTKSAEFKTKDFEHPLADPYIRSKYAELHIKKSDNRENLITNKLNKYFKNQLERIENKLQPDNLKHYRYKGLEDDVFDMTLEIKIAKDEFFPLLEQILKEAGSDAFDLIGTGKEFVLSASIRNWLDDKVDTFARSINQTTYKALKDAFQASFESNETRKDLIKRIQGVYGDISASRANTIARTEVAGATQKGTDEGYIQADVPIKIWVAVSDSRTRHTHSYADGEERPIDMPFSNGLMFPGDPNGPAEEIINCRCSI